MQNENYEHFSTYDVPTMQSYVENARKKRRIEMFFSQGDEISGLENISDIRDEQILFFGNHVSHFDYLLKTVALFENLPKERFPRFIAGSNLKSLSAITKPLWDCSKAGVCWIDRSKKSDRTYMRSLKDAIKKSLEQGDNYVMYPESTRMISAPIPFQDNSRIGLGILKEVFDTNADPFIVPVTVAYNNIIESPFERLINFGRKKNNFIPHFISRGVYYGSDVLAFTSRALSSRDNGKAYLHFGEGKRLSEIISSKKTSDPDSYAVSKYYTTEIQKEYSRIQEHITSN